MCFLEVCEGTAWANTFQTVVFMVLGGGDIFDYLRQAGRNREAASQRVLETNPSRLKRSVDEADQKRYEATYARWEKIAEFNYATRQQDFTLTAEQSKLAFSEFKPQNAQLANHRKSGLCSK